jgi:hypothetical protein
VSGAAGQDTAFVVHFLEQAEAVIAKHLAGLADMALLTIIPQRH